MNKNAIIIMVCLVSLFTSCGLKNDSKTDDRNIPKSLKKYEIGIRAFHSPDSVYAEKNTDGTSLYIWKHETSVISLKEDLRIKEFGSYMLWNGKWHMVTEERIPYTTEDFAEWYDCEGAIMKKGETYTDKKNWSKSDDLSFVDPISIWYYIGVAEDGKEYIGIVYSNCISELKNN